MDDLEREMQSILEAASEAHEPAPADAARVRQALAFALAGAASTAATGAAAAASALTAGSGATSAGGAAGFGSASSLFSIAKYGAIGLLLGTSGIAAGTAVYAVGHDHPTPRPPLAQYQAAPVVPPPERPLVNEPAERVPGVVGVDSSPPRGKPTPRPAALPELRAEAQALRRAQQYLEGDPAGALQQLDTLQRAHPDGVLTEEALVARVLAYCSLGRRDEARRIADHFLAEFPGSVHTARVRASCALTTSASNSTATTAPDDGSDAPPTMNEEPSPPPRSEP